MIVVVGTGSLQWWDGLLQPVLVEVVAHELGNLLSPGSDWSTHSPCGRVEKAQQVPTQWKPLRPKNPSFPFLLVTH